MIGTCGFVVEHFDEFDDVFVGSEQFQGLNLLEFLDFFNSFIFFFHALDGHELVVADRLSHEYF